MSGIRSLTRRPTIVGTATGASAPIYVDSDDNKVKLIPAGSGTTEVELVDHGSAAFTKSVTITDSAVSGARNQLYNQVTLTPTSAITATSGLSAYKGEVNLSSGKTLNGTSFVTGVNGRVNAFGTVDIGSGDLAAVYGKMDLNGSTLTSGHIAPVQSNIVNPPSDSSKVDGYYGESAGGNVINSHFKVFGKAAYVFDIETNVHAPEASETVAVGATQNGYISVNINGSQRYIPLYTTHV